MNEIIITICFDEICGDWIATADLRDGGMEVTVAQDSAREAVIAEARSYLADQHPGREFMISIDE